MKVKFILLTLLLLFSRGCDFYSTSLWFFQKDGIKDERNPLTYFFGVGWSGLIIANILVVGGIIGMLYYFYFRYKRPIMFSQEPKNYKELASLQYFNSPNKFYQIYYKKPKNGKVFIAHLGYVFAVSVIVASFLAAFHNINQFYGSGFYNRYRQIVGRPLFVIYGLYVFTVIFTHHKLLKSEYRKYKIMTKIGC
jgi:hypothetical protein